MDRDRYESCRGGAGGAGVRSGEERGREGPIDS